jgi:hypothetical protein
MPEIQIDMFEVQLGAAMLLQFDMGTEKVCVLADGGVKASGYKAEHVRDKLNDLLTDPMRIDLIIGTHYDEDHLNGLVPVINDERFTISEAWMPPVANDTLSVAVDQPFRQTDLLVHQFATDGAHEIFADYLTAKRADIDALVQLEQALGKEDFARNEGNSDFYKADDPLDVSYFRGQLAGDDDPQCIDHGMDQELESDDLVATLVAEAKTSGMGFQRPWFVPGSDELRIIAAHNKGASFQVASAQAASLSHIRKSAAKDAINAKALFEVVQALKKRSIPIRSEIIDDGTPRTYHWTPSSKRFVLGHPSSDGLSFTLIGPSNSLVKKHRARLPVQVASKVALSFYSEIRSITPSNQLSYIGCFGYAGQRILVSGDAGCVDFAMARNVYHPKLIDALKPLHVVQVAHHGGNNAHFYRVLEAANYHGQSAPSFLLLSHAVHDKTRPSDVFREFLLMTLQEGDDVQLLFTSEPTNDKVEDFLTAIHPAVGPQSTKGDIQLRFDNQAWQVTAHAINVRPVS